MRLLGAWVGRLVVAGSCCSIVGCGGSGVPDPDSDATAVTDQPTQIVGRSAAPEAPVAPATPEPAAGGPVVPVAAGATEPDPAAAAAPGNTAANTPPPTETETPAAPAPKGDSSATDELARLAVSPPPPTTETAPAPGNAAAPGAPGAGMIPAPSGGASSAASNESLAKGSMIPAPGGGATSAASGNAPGQGPIKTAAPGMMATEGGGGPGGMMPSSGGSDPGGGVGANEPADFTRPSTGATAFLSALKAKDKDRLAQAIARRASTEAVEKHRKTFLAISDVSISDEELDELAKALDGYKPMDQLPAVSSGRIDIVLGKEMGGDHYQRKLTMRKEKEGWKLLDIGGVMEFKTARPSSRRR